MTVENITTYGTGEEFREVTQRNLVVYASLSAQDWLDGYAHLEHSDPDAWKILQYRTNAMVEDDTQRNAFRDRVAKEMQVKCDTVSIMCVDEDDIASQGVVRWRVYKPDITPNIAGLRRALGRVTGIFPYIYAPDLLFVGNGTPIRELLDTATSAFTSQTKKSNFLIVTDAYTRNAKHQSALKAHGFTDGDRPQLYNTPVNLAEAVGATYTVRQFITHHTA